MDVSEKGIVEKEWPYLSLPFFQAGAGVGETVAEAGSRKPEAGSRTPEPEAQSPRPKVRCPEP